MNELKQLNVATKNYNGQFEIVDEKARLAVLELNDEVTKLVTDTTELNENIVQLENKVDNSNQKFWHENICPNIYLVTNGTAQANGTLRDYNNTINVLKNLGVKKVSILCAIGSYENNRFYLQTNVDYANVVNKIHEAGMKVESVRFSNSLYGKENMRDETKLAKLATSIPLILNEIGVADEVEFVGILNETSVVYFDETYTSAVVSCIQALQNSGYKVAITDNMRFVLRIPAPILEALDCVGFNEYPLLSGFEELATEFSVAESFEHTQAVMYIDKLKQKGLKVYYSEIGCTNQTNALGTPVEGAIGDYNGMTNILLEFKGFKKYLADSKLNQLIESYNPWFTEVWEATDEMIELFGGE